MTDKKPKVNSAAQTELDKAEKQFQAFDEDIKSMTMDRMNEARKEESEPQTKIAASDLEKTKDIYLKPKRTISAREKFNEDYRSDYNFSKEYVHFVAENKEIIGETITLWTKLFPGIPAEEWEIPVNTPVWAPRYVAERIKGCNYHRFEMKSTLTESGSLGTQFYGQMVVDTTRQRLDAHPVTKKKSVFLGSNNF